MARVSETAPVAGHRARGGLGAKLKALLWEECRVAGVIAGWSAGIGIIALIACRIALGAYAGTRDREFALTIVLGTPMLTALLLILNPDYSGHLVGGFSTRVLRLPVPTWAAVAVTLTTRAFFVCLATLLMVTSSWAIVANSPGSGAVILVTSLYLVAQSLDWRLRAPLTRLGSLLLLLVVEVVVLWCIELVYSNTYAWLLLWVFSPAAPLPVSVAARAALVCVAAAIAYGVSVSAVHAARTGRRMRIPAIREWPQRARISWPMRCRPFASPFAAQFWFDLRRSTWTLPSLTLLLWLLLGLVVAAVPWAFTDILMRSGFVVPNWFTTICPFAALPLAAAGHGIHTRIVGFRSPSGKIGYAYLQPLPAEQFALARVLANAAVLVPVLAAVTSVYVAALGSTFLTRTIPETFDIGAASVREVLWALFSRSLLAGLLAWPLLVVGTRLVRRMVGAALLPFLVIMWVGNDPITTAGRAILGTALILLGVLLVGLTAGAYAYAWKQRLISTRRVVFWAAAWALATWLLYYPFANMEEASRSFVPLCLQGPWKNLFVVLSYAALVPLPYVAVLLDVCRKRHGASPAQDPAQHAAASKAPGRPARVLAAIGAACAVLFILWLGWPARPAYEALWRSRGWPTTLSELDAWYPAVPDEENVALKYLAVASEKARLERRFRTHMMEERAALHTNPHEIISEKLVLLLEVDPPRAGPIPDGHWTTTEAYWNAVTSHVAPQLEKLAQSGPRRSRYPVDLTKRFAADTSHLSHVRALRQELWVDALHWAVAGEPGKAVDAVQAIVPLADSLAKEPLFVSQFVRLAALRIAAHATETVLNRSVPTPRDLARLQQALRQALPRPEDEMIVRRAVIAESAGQLSMLGTGIELDIAGSPVKNRAAAFLWQLAYPPTATRISMIFFWNRYLEEDHRTRSEQAAWQKQMQNWMLDTLNVTPLAAILMPWAGVYVEESDSRTLLGLAQAAIAVEQYRLARGRLPKNLEALVPEFLSAVPEDYFADGAPIRYRYQDDGQYVVYSIGRDAVDDGGDEIENGYRREGDITFTVAPLAVRTAPQVAPAAEENEEARP